MGLIYPPLVQSQMIYCDPDMSLCSVGLPRTECQILWSGEERSILGFTEKAYEQIKWAHCFVGRYKARYETLPFFTEKYEPPLSHEGRRSQIDDTTIMYRMIQRRLEPAGSGNCYWTWEIPIKGLEQYMTSPFLLIRFRMHKKRMRILVLPLENLTCLSTSDSATVLQ